MTNRTTATTMATRSRPLILRDYEVRAILVGIKTSIRLPVEWKPLYTGVPASWPHDFGQAWADPGFPGKDGVYRYGYLHVPYWHPEEHPGEPKWARRVRVYYPLESGDRFWVRETWFHQYGRKDHTGRDPDAVIYRSDGEFRFYHSLTQDPTGSTWDGGTREAESHVSVEGHWRSAAQMPAWASRLTLTVESVRAERLHDITESEAIAEGSRKAIGEDGRAYDNDIKKWNRWSKMLDPHSRIASDEAAFAWQWDTRYGKTKGRSSKPDYSWSANPWVWRVRFRPV